MRVRLHGVTRTSRNRKVAVGLLAAAVAAGTAYAVPTAAHASAADTPDSAPAA